MRSAMRAFCSTRRMVIPCSRMLRLAPRESPALLLLPLLEARAEREDPRQDAGDVVLVVPCESAELQVLEDGHARKDAPSLGGVGDPHADHLVGLEATDQRALEAD